MGDANREFDLVLVAIVGPAPNSRMSLLATDKEKEDHARKQGTQWLQHRREIIGKDTVTREEGKWKVVLNDSPKKLVYDPSRPILVNRVKNNVYDRGSADDILARPLRNFFAIPDGCWRPWDPAS